MKHQKTGENPACFRHGSGGFTLTELLVVIAILAVLVAIAIGGFQKARETAGRASAVSAMRQTGVALISFSSDQNGFLPPGPGKQGLWLSHDAFDGGINMSKGYCLFGFLGPYLGVEAKENRQPVNAAVSKSHLRLYPGLLNTNGKRLGVYASSRSIEIEPGVRKPIFGYYGDWGTPTQTSALSLAAVQNAVDNKWKFLLQEADKEGGWSASWDASLFPEKPVHGTVRHRLYVDGHVQALSLSESNLY